MIGWKCINTERSQDLFEFWKPQKTLNKSDLLPQSQSQRQQKRFFLLYLDFTSKTQAQGAPLGAKALFFWSTSASTKQFGGVVVSMMEVKRGFIVRYTKISWQYLAAARYNNYFIYNIQFIHRTWTKYSPYLLIDSKGRAVTSMSFSIWIFQSPKLLQTSFPP